MTIGLTHLFFARQLRLERLSIGFGSMPQSRFVTLQGSLLSMKSFSLDKLPYLPSMFIGMRLSKIIAFQH